MHLVDRLVHFVELRGVEELDGVEVGHHRNGFVLLAVLLQQLLHLPGPLPHVGRSLPQLTPVHELSYLLGLVPVSDPFKMYLLQKLKIFLLVFIRIVFDKPELPLRLHLRKIKFIELLLLQVNAPAHL